jgi:hypothetical protein
MSLTSWTVVASRMSLTWWAGLDRALAVVPLFSAWITPAPMFVLRGLLASQMLWCLYWQIDWTEFLPLASALGWTPAEKSRDFRAVWTMPEVDWRRKSLCWRAWGSELSLALVRSLDEFSARMKLSFRAGPPLGWLVAVLWRSLLVFVLEYT